MSPDEQLGGGASYQSVHDPQGNEFFVQAVPGFGVPGPVWLARESDPFPQGRFLRLVNRLLARVQRPRSFESAAVTVLRIGDEGEDTVLFEPLDTLAEAAAGPRRLRKRSSPVPSGPATVKARFPRSAGSN